MNQNFDKAVEVCAEVIAQEAGVKFNPSQMRIMLLSQPTLYHVRRFATIDAEERQNLLDAVAQEFLDKDWPVDSDLHHSGFLHELHECAVARGYSLAPMPVPVAVPVKRRARHR